MFLENSFQFAFSHIERPLLIFTLSAEQL